MKQTHADLISHGHEEACNREAESWPIRDLRRAKPLLGTARNESVSR